MDPRCWRRGRRQVAHLTDTRSQSGPNLAQLGTDFTPSWASWEAPYPSKVANLCRFLKVFLTWRSWSHFPRTYPIQSHPGLILGPLGAVWNHLVTILGPSWGHFGLPGASLGLYLGLLNGILADLGAILSRPRPLGGGPFGDLGPTWTLWGLPGAS